MNWPYIMLKKFKNCLSRMIYPDGSLLTIGYEISKLFIINDVFGFQYIKTAIIYDTITNYKNTSLIVLQKEIVFLKNIEIIVNKHFKL